jgi:hypothetical protein
LSEHIRLSLAQIFLILYELYIIPIPPAPPCGIGGSGSLIWVMPASVVSSMLATEAAF